MKEGRSYSRRIILTIVSLPIAASAADVPMSLVDNRPFVEVRINGEGPFSFLLDTGSSVTSVSADLSRRLGLQVTQSGQGSGTGNKPVSFNVVHVTSMKVGPVSIGPFDAPAMDTKRLSQAIGFRKFDGVLGAEIFKVHIFTLDAFRRRISITDASRFRAPAGAVAIPFLLDENDMPVIKASVSGVTGSFQVDTGDRSSLTLFGPFWRKHNLDQRVTPTVTAMTGYGGGGPILAIVGRPTSAAIGDIALPTPVTRLSLQTGGTFTRVDRAGSIGMGILRRFNVSFDYQHHIMWLSKLPSFAAPDRYDRSGLWLGLTDGNGLQVLAVTPGSPASRANIREGDLVRNVGSLPAIAANLFAIRRMLQQPGIRILSISAIHQGLRYHARIALKDQIAPPPRIGTSLKRTAPAKGSSYGHRS